MIRPASARPSGPLVAAVVMLGLFALMAAHLMVAQPPVTQPLDDAWRAWVGADAPVGGPLFWFFEQLGYGLGYALLAGVSLVTASVLLCGGMVWQRTVANAHWLSDTVFGVLAGVAATMVVGWLLHDRVEIEQARGWRWVWQQASASSRPLS